ncbi:MAG: CoA ester lyase [Hydrogenophaga sp.]|uniref:HpcH/HpaI aldolase/citrate lyase family protein n=1 Tax=Hydrogenophaga sp. TaxID=1904254 RepID=UPI0016A3103A|nr:CoA ester lyase [Hydrogenophaga sp.]NIM43863.1 CoA ester lyase [Hydrogenophaga sp.]NIN28929.1 CoA ester lyase [Hydrogenophaga sp.]NIN33388.1 CoA ester lyase [Hydrogenophaga sp.]NIN58063.1 CoA ester lyase [Hydrogenophaga sp.]NIO54361.1 CoA ester lyase [Hydrogenophaga sp.]
MTGIALARSFLFLPADRLDRLPKALASGAHALVLDLEDAVAPGRKGDAREALARLWPTLDAEVRARLMLRINASPTPWHAEDAALLGELQGLGALMPAKVEAPADLVRLFAAFPARRWLPLIESAEGLAQIDAIARVPGVMRLAFGHLDFQADLGMACDADEAELAPVRFAFVVASRRAGIAPPVDGVTTALQDNERLNADARRARRFGFGGKLCIHPAQVATVNAALGPSDGQRAWALRVLQAAATQGDGAFRFEGAMVDAPVLARARRFAQDINQQEKA